MSEQRLHTRVTYLSFTLKLCLCGGVFSQPAAAVLFCFLFHSFADAVQWCSLFTWLSAPDLISAEVLSYFQMVTVQTVGCH